MEKICIRFNSFLTIFIPLFLVVVMVSTLLIASSVAKAETIVTAQSGSASSIQSAVNTVSAAGGGTVRIPAGTINLGGSVTVRTNVSLIGAGMDKTVLRTSGTSQVIRVQGNNARLSGFSLISTNYDGGNGIEVSNSVDFRIDHLRIEGYSRQAAVYVRGGSSRGVIDHNWIKNKPASSLNYGVVVYGDDTWIKDPQLGTKYAVFIEDNTFINTRHAVASNAGAHYVFRYNLVQKGVAGQAVDAHGPYYGGDEGTRAFEVYGNVIESPESSGSERAVCIRGGEGVIFNNTIKGYKYAVLFRIEDGQSGSYPLYHQPQNVYIWNNTWNGQYGVGYSSLNNTTTYIKQNRDWFAYALPGYTPYTYPHPLATGGILPPPPVNNPPNAVNDSYNVNQDSVLTINAPGVLSNDNDTEGNNLTAILASNPSHGAVSLNSNGSFTYTPGSGYSGADSFTYKASDGTSSSGIATVTITVNPVVTPPPTTPPPTTPPPTTPPPSGDASFGLDNGNYTYNQLSNVINAMRFRNDGGSGTLTNLQILIDDTTPAGKVRLGIYADNNGVPGALLLDAGEAALTNGWVTISGLSLSVNEGSYYWLTFNLSATTQVKYQSGQPARSHYRITSAYNALPAQYPANALNNALQYVLRAEISKAPVNNPPAAADDSFTVDQDKVLSVPAPGILVNDDDADGDTVVPLVAAGTAHGVISVAADGSFTYTPNSGFSGTDSFTYRVTDGTDVSNAATVTITVNPVVTPPPTTPPPTTPPPSEETSFGLNNGNNTYNQLPNVINAMRFQNDGGSGTLSELQILINDTTPNGKVRLGVYADNNGAPGALLLDAGEVIITNGWVTISNLNLAVSKGAYYWLAFNLSVANNIKYQSNQAAGSHYRVNYAYGALPNQYPSGGLTNNNEYVMSAGVTLVVIPPEPIEVSFGLNNGSLVYNQSGGVINAMRFLNDGGTGKLTKLQILIKDTTPDGTVRLGVYADNNGAPGALLLDAGEAKVTNGWVTISGLNLPVSQDTCYWLAFNLSKANGVAYEAKQPTNSHRWTTYAYGLPAQYPANPSDNNNRYVLRAIVISY